MKWNDAWLSNIDRDDDGKLDRHYGLPSYIGSGAWLTNHEFGTSDEDPWNYFVKIAAAPADATPIGGIWYTASGGEIGTQIWGEFAILQGVYNDKSAGEHGLAEISPEGPGLGKY